MQFNLLICFVVVSAVVGDQSKTSNDSDDSSNEVQQLRAELAKSNCKGLIFRRAYCQYLEQLTT